ncbi:MAG: ATP-binding protein [Myxococcota bacterium]
MAETEGRPVNILVVDDRPANVRAIEAILDQPDYRIVPALSGEEALRQVLHQDFAVILLDVAMPGMDGFETAALIKQREASREIPIIFVTATVYEMEQVFHGYTMGAVDYLLKPLDPHALRAKVSVFVQLFRQRRRIAEQAEQLREAERRQGELEMMRVRFEAERRYRNLAEAVPQIVWRATPDGTWEYVNRRWLEATGLAPGQALGEGWTHALHPADVDPHRLSWQESVRSGAPFERESRLRSAEGSYRWYLCRALPERSAEQGITGWLGTFTDVDDQKRRAEERAELLERAEEGVRTRDTFLAVAAHELKTPLTPLRLETQLLRRALEQGVREQLVPERVMPRLQLMERQIGRLERLTNDLLEVARATRGYLELQRDTVDLSALLTEVVARHQQEAERGGTPMHVNVQPGVVGYWDAGRLEQVFTNLISNAIKYGRGQPILVTLDVDDVQARIRVQDHGIGVPPESQQRIFERFERAVSSVHYGGLGLGLWISQKIVEAHGGRIELDSQPGAGATFTVFLPRRVVEKQDDATAYLSHSASPA